MRERYIWTLPLIGFALLLTLLLGSSLMLYIDRYGLSVDNLYTAFSGDSEEMIQPKSALGILKSFTPHMIAMPLIFFILFHLVAAAKLFSKEAKMRIMIAGLGSCLTDIMITFIIAWHPLFAWLKAGSFLLFEALLFYLMWVLLQTIYQRS